MTYRHEYDVIQKIEVATYCTAYFVLLTSVRQISRGSPGYTRDKECEEARPMHVEACKAEGQTTQPISQLMTNCCCCAVAVAVRAHTRKKNDVFRSIYYLVQSYRVGLIHDRYLTQLNLQS